MWMQWHFSSQESSPTTQFKSINSLVLSFLYSPTLTSIHETGKTIALNRRTLVGKVISLLFNMLSRLVITKWHPTPVFLPGESHGRRSLVGYSPRVKKSRTRLSDFSLHFLPRSKRLLIPWLQSPSAVILEPPKIKSDTVATVIPIYFPWSDGTRCHDLHFLNVEL